MKFICGNWKMNKNRKEVSQYFEALIPQLHDSDHILLAVPFVYLQQAIDCVQGTSITIAAQNVHQQTSGAYTGEISVGMLRDIGISWTLVGHSERRQYFAETNESVAAKVDACLNGDIQPIVCIGETLNERESSKTFDVLARQLDALYERFQRSPRVVLAYEPVWAIGTGKTATAEQAQEVHAWIRRQLKERGIQKSTILYGGSVTPQNSPTLLSQPDIDGALIGGASLKPLDFSAIFQSCR